MKTEDTFNRLALTALLHDQIMYLKFGHHLAKNWKQAKDRLCTMAGQKTNITTVNVIRLIGLTMVDNGLGDIFHSTIEKMKIGDKIYN